MINAIINGLLSFVSQLIEACFFPLDTLISNYMPDVTAILSYISNFFNLLENYGAFVLSYTGLTHEIIGFAVLMIVATIYIAFLTLGIKLILRWYRMLMP